MNRDFVYELWGIYFVLTLFYVILYNQRIRIFVWINIYWLHLRSSRAYCSWTILFNIQNTIKEYIIYFFWISINQLYFRIMLIVHELGYHLETEFPICFLEVAHEVMVRSMWVHINLHGYMGIPIYVHNFSLFIKQSIMLPI